MAPTQHPENLRLVTLETRDLKETIRALRAELERVRLEDDVRLQNAIGVANGEIGHLRTTITRLREQLDRVNAAWEERVTAVESSNRNKCRELERTIKILREQLQNTTDMG